MSLVIIDSGGANIASIKFAFENIGQNTVFTDDPDIIKSADRVILPGVGAARDAMTGLKNKNLIDLISNLAQPVLGICLGMQLLFDHSEEGDVDLLKLAHGNVSHFTPAPNKTIPHMGWNNVTIKRDHPLTHNIAQDSYFYFVHSYYVGVNNTTLGSCDYQGEKFSAIITKDNVMGCQFHPERSSDTGLQILKNFSEIKL